MKKICGFCASDVHFIMMVLPFLKDKLQTSSKIETFFEYDFKENLNKILSNLMINKNYKEKISAINWSSNKIKKYSSIDNQLKSILNKNDEIVFLISGSKKYIKETNNLLNKILSKYNNYYNINIINCFFIEEFDDDIRDVLDSHEFILNTSGIHRIDEVFEDYKKIKINK